jgi:hypothetical protein
VVMTRGRQNLVSSTQHELPHDIGRNVRVTRFCQVAVRGAPDEASLALWIEPTSGLSIWNDRRDRCAWALTLTLAWLAAWSVLLALSPASALVARAASIVPVIALATASSPPAAARVTVLIALARLTAPTTSLGIVLSLRLWCASGCVRSVGRRRRRRRIRFHTGRGLIGRRWSGGGRGRNCW